MPPDNTIPTKIEKRLLQSLQNRIKIGTIRSLTPKQSQQIDFSSNDYLGLSQCTNQLSLVNSTYNKYKENVVLGATGSRLLSGNQRYHTKLETYLAKLHNRKYALLFNSGYDANLSVLSSLPCENDVVLFDELCHNSLFTGYKLSRCFVNNHNFITFKHNNVNDLEKLLIQYNNENRCIFIVLESVYSMDGDISPLSSICKIAQKYNAFIILDEAHALGIFGKNGTGMLSEENLEQHPNILCSVYTFGKAAGCHGAIVVCNTLVLKEYLINYARPFIYSTALPLHSVATVQCAYTTITGEEGYKRRRKLHELVTYFQREISKFSSVKLINSPSPIQAIIIRGNERCLAIAKKLNQCGFDVYPIHAPTILAGSERIRIILHYHTSFVEVKSFINCLKFVINDIGADDNLALISIL